MNVLARSGSASKQLALPALVMNVATVLSPTDTGLQITE